MVHIKKNQKKKTAAGAKLNPTTYPLEWLLLKRPTMPSVGEVVKHRELLYTAGANVKWYNHFGKQCALPSPPDLPLLGIYPGEMKYMSTQRLVHKYP